MSGREVVAIAAGTGTFQQYEVEDVGSDRVLVVGWQVVVDVGCGTGILSIFCAYAGARKAGFYLCSFSKSRMLTPGHIKVDGDKY